MFFILICTIGILGYFLYEKQNELDKIKNSIQSTENIEQLTKLKQSIKSEDSQDKKEER
ncbi:hypothetical protein ['Camptotheca acuminata' phytoplasma]|uniref:hypothetical protein n=1 Tax='Camptotheca acuminata' phytoplasma TaxID=3239192 RepID=UPI00351A9E9D